MNTDFRRFVLGAEVSDRDYTQSLLFHTQKLFAFMQGSIRRFISPEDCVASIKTYEDTQIDIHSQMDVDEFYNLLFDRRERTLSRKAFKRTSMEKSCKAITSTSVRRAIVMLTRSRGRA
jgi:hypothetical protein